MVRAVKKLLSMVVQCCVSDSSNPDNKGACSKDYVTESDETCIYDAIHSMVAILDGSLGHVACKETLRTSISCQLRNSFLGLNVPNEHLEQAVALVINDNLDFGCAVIEQATSEKVVLKVYLHKNQGGYDLLGRTQDQIRTTEQVNAALTACNDLKLDGLVIIGGVTSYIDAAQLTETFAEAKCQTKVVGVPVTLNGNLKNQFVETNVGFDTICKRKSIPSSSATFALDALSAEKYYYFVHLMGRKASHIALECTLQSHPNMVILGEEVAASKLTLFEITNLICDAAQARAEQDKNHGVILLPEGLIKSIPEVECAVEGNSRFAQADRQGVSAEKISSQLSPWASALFELLPPFLRKQLLHPESDDSVEFHRLIQRNFWHIL